MCVQNTFIPISAYVHCICNCLRGPSCGPVIKMRHIPTSLL